MLKLAFVFCQPKVNMVLLFARITEDIFVEAKAFCFVLNVFVILIEKPKYDS